MVHMSSEVLTSARELHLSLQESTISAAQLALRVPAALALVLASVAQDTVEDLLLTVYCISV